MVLVTVKQSSYVRVIREGEHDTGLASSLFGWFIQPDETLTLQLHM